MFFRCSNKGGPIHNYPDGISENSFDGNVLYNCEGGSIFMGNGKDSITNNISLKTARMLLHEGFSFKNNYCEGAYPFSFACLAAKGAYTGTFEKFAMTGNVFNNTGMDRLPGQHRGCQAVQHLDGNVYLGNQRWLVGLTQANRRRRGIRTTVGFASYVACSFEHCPTARPGRRTRGQVRRRRGSTLPRSTPSSTPILRSATSC